MKRPDVRPVCTCGAYAFPHKLGGGRCTGEDFAQAYLIYDRSDCEGCVCSGDDNPHTCDCADGREPIFLGACYQEAMHCNPGAQVTLTYDTLNDPRYEEPEDDTE